MHVVDHTPADFPHFHIDRIPVERADFHIDHTPVDCSCFRTDRIDPVDGVCFRIGRTDFGPVRTGLATDIIDVQSYRSQRSAYQNPLCVQIYCIYIIMFSEQLNLIFVKKAYFSTNFSKKSCNFSRTSNDIAEEMATASVGTSPQ